MQIVSLFFYIKIFLTLTFKRVVFYLKDYFYLCIIACWASSFNYKYICSVCLSHRRHRHPSIMLYGHSCYFQNTTKTIWTLLFSYTSSKGKYTWHAWVCYPELYCQIPVRWCWTVVSSVCLLHLPIVCDMTADFLQMSWILKKKTLCSLFQSLKPYHISKLLSYVLSISYNSSSFLHDLVFFNKSIILSIKYFLFPVWTSTEYETVHLLHSPCSIPADSTLQFLLRSSKAATKLSWLLIWKVK